MLHFGSVPALIVSSADAVREIVKNQDLIFSHRPKSSIMHKIVYGSKDIAFARYGDHWRHVRSIAVLQLLSSKRVQSYRQIREEETSLMIEKIRNLSSSSTSFINLSKVLVSLTNDIISRVVLGGKYSGGEETENFELMLKEIGELLVAFNPGDYVPWLKWINRVNGLNARLEKVAKSFDEFLTRVVGEHISLKQGKTDRDGSSNEVDFVDILLEIQRENSSSSPIETDTIKALIFDMFGAGVDELALAKLMQTFNFAAQKDLDMTEAPGTTVHIKFPLLVTPIPHLASN
ncbi:unnamed protein product [Fraxinus pennsylvanica]|uniref:Cytochrome P450 n=1 Tax=Fraxinus pennsylvanica TaxID=56036 RepID=A0AAD1YVH3_9LAMI|nr:unnamed protein product [Fraxinus pennsylvanica]